MTEPSRILSKTDEQILKISTVASWTVEKERAALTRLDALVILLRAHRAMMYGYFTYTVQDVVDKLDAERDFLRFRAEISREVFGV